MQDGSAAYEPIDIPVCDGRTTREKLAELLEIGTEQTALDYKATIDLRKTYDVVEMARDLAAMRSNLRGGYLVYGVDNTGQPAHSKDPIIRSQFDEAEIRQKVEKFLGKAFDLSSTVHDKDGRDIAVVYVARAPFGLSPMEANGDYDDQGGSKRSRFKRGDVFVRHGTQVAALSATDIPRIFAPDIDAIKRNAQSEYTQLVGSLRQAESGSQIAQSTVGALNWRLSQEEFDGGVIQALRSGDSMMLQAMLIQLVGAANALLSNVANRSDLHALLDRLISVLGIAIAFDNALLRDRALPLLRRIYQLGDDRGGYPRGNVAITTAELLLAVSARIEAVGALAIRLEQWAAVRRIILQPSWDGYYTSWLRHAVTEASRGQLLTRQTGDRKVAVSFVSFAYDLVNKVPALRPDLPDAALGGRVGRGDPPNEDAILDSILQFDFAWCLLAVLHSEAGDIRQFYPSFALYYGRRLSVFAERLLTDESMRAELLGDVSDDQLRQALRQIIDRSEKEAAVHGMFGFDIATHKLTAFLDVGTE